MYKFCWCGNRTRDPCVSAGAQTSAIDGSSYTWSRCKMSLVVTCSNLPRLSSVQQHRFHGGPEYLWSTLLINFRDCHTERSCVNVALPLAILEVTSSSVPLEHVAYCVFACKKSLDRVKNLLRLRRPPTYASALATWTFL